MEPCYTKHAFSQLQLFVIYAKGQQHVHTYCSPSLPLHFTNIYIPSPPLSFSVLELTSVPCMILASGVHAVARTSVLLLSSPSTYATSSVSHTAARSHRQRIFAESLLCSGQEANIQLASQLLTTSLQCPVPRPELQSSKATPLSGSPTSCPMASLLSLLSMQPGSISTLLPALKTET